MGNLAEALNKANGNKPVVVKAAGETPVQKLARIERENAELRATLQAQREAQAKAAGAFEISVTVHREPGTKNAQDKGSKGGSLRVAVGKQNIYPSVAMIEAIFEHEEEIRKFIVENVTKLSR